MGRVLSACLAFAWPAWALAMASTDVLSNDEHAMARQAEQFGWPDGTLAMVNDPLKMKGWQFWFSECPNDTCTFGFEAGNMVDVNRLVWTFAEIESENWVIELAPSTGGKDALLPGPEYPIVFRVGGPKVYAAWFDRLKETTNEKGEKIRTWGVHEFPAGMETPPAALFLTLHAGSPLIDLSKLDVPPHVTVSAAINEKYRQENPEDEMIERIDRFVEQHAGKQAATKEPRPWTKVACPAWAKVTFPRDLRAYQGRFGLPEPWSTQAGPIAPTVSGIDFWHANHTLAYNGVTRNYLYGTCEPFLVDYAKGMLPAYEKVVAKYTAGIENDRDKAIALLTRAVPELLPHPEMPPLGPACPPDRGLLDEPLLASGKGWCNEQARAFVRLCQVAGIPARLIFLWYTPPNGGHVVAEFLLDGRWAMADASWFCVFPNGQGGLMSARECHLSIPNKQRVGRIYHERMQALDALDDETLVGRKFAHITNDDERARAIAAEARRMREKFFQRSAGAIGDELWRFSVMPYPLPQGPAKAVAATTQPASGG